MTDFITFGEAIRLVGFNKAAQMMRRALGIKTLAPWPNKPEPLSALSSPDEDQKCE